MHEDMPHYLVCVQIGEARLGQHRKAERNSGVAVVAVAVAVVAAARVVLTLRWCSLWRGCTAGLSVFQAQNEATSGGYCNGAIVGRQAQPDLGQPVDHLHLVAG